MEGPGRQLPAAPGTPYEKGPGDPGPCLKASEAGFRPSWLQSGGDERDRTADLLVANEALSHLSYIPRTAPVVARRDIVPYPRRQGQGKGR
jgi:hypothetical protein